MLANRLACLVLLGLAYLVAGADDEYHVKYNQLEPAEIEQKSSMRLLEPHVMPGLKDPNMSPYLVHLAPCSINWPHKHNLANELLYVK